MAGFLLKKGLALILGKIVYHPPWVMCYIAYPVPDNTVGKARAVG